MQVIYEDNHLIIINKTCAEIVQADKTGDKPLTEMLQEYLKEKYKKPGNVFVGITHRLDRPTSGVVVFAKTSKSLKRMNDLFRVHDLTKKYWAIVKNCPPEPEMRLVNYLTRNEKMNKSFAYDKEVPGSKKAALNFKVIAKSDNYYLLEVTLETGRHHQIRCQLAHIGCPIKGDLKYGAPRSNQDGGICLHARSISFVHPVSGKRVKVVAPVPDESLWNDFEKMACQNGYDEHTEILEPELPPAPNVPFRSRIDFGKEKI